MAASKPKPPSEDLGCSLGELISYYRGRRNRAQDKMPWSQEDLAFAVGTSQSRISQIEADLNHPQRETVERICEALRISYAERNCLLALAGYQDELSLPDEKAVASVISMLSPTLEVYPYPAMLIDDSERVWYWNPLVIPVWGPCFGVSDQKEFASQIRGRRPIEVLFGVGDGGACCQSWQNHVADFESLMTRAVTMFWRAYCLHANDSSMKLAMSQLKQNPRFLQVWRQLLEGKRQPLFVEHAVQVAHISSWRELRFHVWRAHLFSDSRFVVVHYTPIDHSTLCAMERIRAREHAGTMGPITRDANFAQYRVGRAKDLPGEAIPPARGRLEF